MPKAEKILKKITFSGLTIKDKVTFDGREPKIILVNIFNPILKLENCIWLEEI